jgi:predicted ABC-type ATPase
MHPPEMFIVAGPPGAGKSSVFPLAIFADHVFNADDRAAELNGGSYRAIPLHVRRTVNQEFEQFVGHSINSGQSFALETTLRSSVTFEQAKLAKSVGFKVFMIYVALDSFDRHLERVKRRAIRGGHAASESTLRRIHESSLANLPIALDPEGSGVEELRVFDNSAEEETPRLKLEVKQGHIAHIADEFPAWLQDALEWTSFDIERIRSDIRVGESE